MSGSKHETYLNPSEATGAALLARSLPGAVVMLNLLRFREIADYSDFPDIAPPEPISGRQAYERYVDHTLPFLRAAGGRILYAGTGGDYLVGPPGQGWDMALLVEQSSVDSFMAFTSNTEYLAGIGHRIAALHDSRILPLVDALVSVVG